MNITETDSALNTVKTFPSDCGKFKDAMIEQVCDVDGKLFHGINSFNHNADGEVTVNGNKGGSEIFKALYQLRADKFKAIKQPL